jgi:hypothetical protein
LAGFGIFGFAAAFVWSLRIQRYIESHGGHSACVFFNGAMLRDYRTARRIARRLGRKPRFLIWFEGLAITAMAFFIAVVLVVAIGGLK